MSLDLKKETMPMAGKDSGGWAEGPVAVYRESKSPWVVIPLLSPDSLRVPISQVSLQPDRVKRSGVIYPGLNNVM